MTSFVRALALGLVAVAGAACTNPLASGPEHAYNVDEQYPIVVEPQVATLVVQVDEGLKASAAASTNACAPSSSGGRRAAKAC